MKKPLISVLYFLIGITCIILQAQSLFLPGFVAKALIIPVLMILFLLNPAPHPNRLHKFMFAGLFFSWAGDVTLEFSQNNGNFFILGLACFLLAHIMYLTVFFFTPGKNIITGNRIYLIIPVLIYGTMLVSFLYAYLASMRLPVILYAIVILTMLTAAINRKEKVEKVSYYLVLGGAILFVISDSAIAVNKFSYQFKSSEIVIMSTYIVAQYLIVAGYIYQFSNVNSDQISR